MRYRFQGEAEGRGLMTPVFGHRCWMRLRRGDQQRPDPQAVAVSSAGSAFAAQLLHARSDRRKIVSGSGSGHVSSVS